MTLVEVAYIINGSVDVQKLNGVFHATLNDTTHDPCVAEIKGSGENESTIGVGKTEDEAKENLAAMMRGKTIIYYIPIMYKVSAERLRIPETLVP